MAQGRIPTAPARRWLLRGALVGGAVGAALLLGGPAQAAETTPPGPVAGLLGGLTSALDGTSGAAFGMATGTVDRALPAVQDAPVVLEVAVVSELPVTAAVRGAAHETAVAVRDLTATVDQELVPVGRPVDTLVEVVTPVVDAVTVPDEGDAAVQPGAPTTPSLPAAGLSAAPADDDSAATGSVGPAAHSRPDARTESPGPPERTPTAPWPLHDPATGAGSVSGAGGLTGPDLVARAPGRDVISPDHAGVRPLAPDDAHAASSSPTPPFSPD